MENSSNASQPDNNLCTKCMTFYGTKANQGMCSKCYKEEMKNRVEPAKPASKMDIEPKPTTEAAIPQAEPPKVQAVPEVDKNKCYHCKKKTGMYGFQCKCGFNFCKMHRIPEDHECSYDFATHGQKLLEKNNPQIVGKKLDEL